VQGRRRYPGQCPGESGTEGSTWQTGDLKSGWTNICTRDAPPPEVIERDRLAREVAALKVENKNLRSAVRSALTLLKPYSDRSG
jgi:hypothetical protein